MSKLSEQLEFVWKINESSLNKLSNSMISSSLTYIPNKLKMNKIWIFNIRLNYNHSYKVRKQRNERVLTLIYGLWCKWLRCGGMHDAWCMMHDAWGDGLWLCFNRIWKTRRRQAKFELFWCLIYAGGMGVNKLRNKKENGENEGETKEELQGE
jgi:hypothetical protein